MKLIHLVLASVLAVGPAVGVSRAADPVVPPVIVDPGFDWTGFYAGIRGGAGVVDYTGTVGAVTASWSAPAWSLGGVVGAQTQVGRWVLGVEGDINWVGANGTVPLALAVGTSSAQWRGSMRGKLGITANRWMLYGTAGVAGFNNNISVNGGVPPINNTHFGGVVGIGVNYAATDSLVLGAGINYYAFEPKLYNPDTRADALEIVFDALLLLGGGGRTRGSIESLLPD